MGIMDRIDKAARALDAFFASDRSPERADRLEREAKRRRDLAHVQRRELIEALGARCAMESAECDGDLEVDHPRGRDYEPNRLNQLQRLRRYRRDAAAGRVRLLCRHHNAEAGSQRTKAKTRRVRVGDV
jgi:hypothetical protein